MSHSLKLSDPTVRAIVSAAFPDYGGRAVEYVSADTFRPYGTLWDEGNRRTYRLVRLSDMGTCCVPEEPFGVSSPAYHNDQRIPDGCVVVVWCECRWEHIEIIGPTSAVSLALPAPVELSREDRIVLAATRTLKSSYAGIKNYRFHAAQQYTGITLAEWDAAKDSLIDRGFLNRAGGLFHMPEREYGELSEDNGGLCLYCGEPAYGVEPDARRYVCEGCDQPQVYGLEELLIMGRIEFTD